MLWLSQKFCLILRFESFLKFTKGHPRKRRSSLPLTQHSRIASPHLLPPIVPWMLALWQQLLTRGWQTGWCGDAFSSALPSSPKHPFRGDPRFPAESAFFSSQLPPSHVPPQTWFWSWHCLENKWDKSAWRRISRFPFLPIPGLGRVVTRWMINLGLRASSLRLFDVRSGKWSLM